MEQNPQQREALLDKLFPEGIPRLWVPLLTFYDQEAQIDPVHTQAHHDFLSPHVSSFLTPGSTGDGWELSPGESDTVLKMQLEVARRRGHWLMVGVLRTGRGEAVEAIRRMVQRFAGGWSVSKGDINWELLERLLRRRIAGFTVTPPKGAELSQNEIYEELASVLELGLPISLYQLPQVTENIMESETVAALAERYPSFYLLKDTSGEDLVASSGADLHGVFLVRGAEGGYSDHLKSAGGDYDGYLLSSANCFARELRQVQWLCDNNQHGDARKLARRVSTVIDHAFGLVDELPFGNPFSNANRAIDHIFAYGNGSKIVPPPMTHSGSPIPEAVISTLREVMKEEGFETELGYIHPEIHSRDE